MTINPYDERDKIWDQYFVNRLAKIAATVGNTNRVKSPNLPPVLADWNTWDFTNINNNAPLVCRREYLVKLKDGTEIKAIYDDHWDDNGNLPPYWVLPQQIEIDGKIQHCDYDISEHVIYWREIK